MHRTSSPDSVQMICIGFTTIKIKAVLCKNIVFAHVGQLYVHISLLSIRTRGMESFRHKELQ